MAQAEPTHNVVSASYGAADGGGSVSVDVAGDQYVTAAASTSMAACSHESSLYVTAGLSEVQIRAAIEKSKDQGWSELAKMGTGQVVGVGSLSAADVLIWEELKKKHLSLFPDNVKVKLGRVIAEGGQAQIYEAEVIHDGPAKIYPGAEVDAPDPHRYVAKVFRMAGFSLAELQRQWPLDTHNPRLSFLLNGELLFWGPSIFCCKVDYGMFLEDGRFAFLMERCWGDLRTLIDLQLKNMNSQAGSPFSDLEAMKIMQHIAFGVADLHLRGVLHRDLKAANVLIRTYDHKFRQGDAFIVDENCQAWVADYESSLMVQGTGFWRAPEVLKELQKLPCDRNAMIWTEQVDVYSYAMTCYEILTGLIPFDGCHTLDWDRIIVHGERPHVPHYVNPKLKDLMERCWHGDSSKRPRFGAIVVELESMLR